MEQLILFVLNYTKLMRFKTSFLIGFSSILGAWFYYNENTMDLTYIDIFLRIASVFLLVLLSSGSLNLFNDIIDLKIDKELKPERILPQGTVTIQKAYLFFVVSVLACFVLSISLNMVVSIIYLVMLIVGISYSLFLQNIPLVKNFVVGFSISMSILVGYFSLVVNEGFSPSIKVVVIFILSLISIVSFELQKDINDVEIDKKFNKITFPVIFGKKKSSVLVYIIYWFLLIVFWIYLLIDHTNSNWIIYLVLIIIQLYLLFSIRNITIDQSFSVLERARIRVYLLFAITLMFLFIF